jgi:hypothetical protein
LKLAGLMLNFHMLKHLSGLAKKKLKRLALVLFFNNIPVSGHRHHIFAQVFCVRKVGYSGQRKLAQFCGAFDRSQIWGFQIV